MLARYYVALLRLHDRNHEGYRAACQAALVQGERSSNAYSQYLAAWCGLLGPDSGIEMERAIQLANRACESFPNNSAYRQAAAIARYRAGKFQQAHDLLLACIEADSAADSNNLTLVYSRLFFAMTELRLNRPMDAQRTLQEALAGVDALLAKPDLVWDYRLTLKLWREEAEQVVSLGERQERG
jgi:hypothetical protein